MSLIPRVITVDPTSAVSRLVRAAIDLSDRPAIQVDMRGSLEALEEIKRGGYRLMVTSLRIDRQMKGFELALRVSQVFPETAIVILADVDDLEELDEETRAQSPFVYLRRPVDPAQFIRVLTAGLEGEDVFAAADTWNGAQGASPFVDVLDLGPVPEFDLKTAHKIIDSLLIDVGALAVVLSSRTGDILLERGASGYLDRTELSVALLPTMRTTVSMGGLVGGQVTAIQFFDGDTYDVFVLSVGFHHFISVIFDGQAGARQFGAVMRFARRTVDDLRNLLGANAYMVEVPVAPAPLPPAPPPLKRRTQEMLEETLPVMPVMHTRLLSEPEILPSDTAKLRPIEEVLASKSVKLEPINNFDPHILDQLDALDDTMADDFFNPDKLAQIADENRRGGPLTYDEARELGIVP